MVVMYESLSFMMLNTIGVVLKYLIMLYLNIFKYIIPASYHKMVMWLYVIATIIFMIVMSRAPRHG